MASNEEAQSVNEWMASVDEDKIHIFIEDITHKLLVLVQAAEE